MNKYLIISLLFLIFMLTSCDGGDGAFIINNTNETVTIKLRQTIKPSEDFNSMIFLKASDEKDTKGIGDLTIEYDSLDNSVKFKLLPNEKVNLGRTFLTSRDNYQNWEFDELEIELKDGKIAAKNDGILMLADRKEPWFSYPDYYINIGSK